MCCLMNQQDAERGCRVGYHLCVIVFLKNRFPYFYLGIEYSQKDTNHRNCLWEALGRRGRRGNET